MLLVEEKVILVGKKVLKTLGVGALIGAGLGILFAPKKGSETREDIMKKVGKAKEDVCNIDAEDVKAYFENKKNEIEAAIHDLDKEKVKDIAIKKAKDLEKECKKLVKFVKDKSEPVLIDAAEALRDQAQKVIDNYEAKKK